MKSKVRKIAVRLICALVIILLLPLLLKSCIQFFATHSASTYVDSMYMNTANGEYTDYGDYGIPIINKRVFYNTVINEFQPTMMSKKRLFNYIKKNYEIFDESEDIIDFVYGNKVYAIEKVDERLGKNQYRLYEEYFTFEPLSGYSRVPFPINMINERGGLMPVIYSNFSIKCDMEYLRRFYEYYDYIKVEDNTIKYGDITMEVTDNNQVELSYPQE